jgi:hypothetical protein
MTRAEPVTMPDGSVARFYSLADVQSAYIEATTDRTVDGIAVDAESSPALDYCVRSWTDNPEWTGATDAEVREWIRRGYDLPTLPDDVPRPAADLSEKPRWRRSDDPEGEFQYDDFLNGEPEYYLARDRVGPKPGINVEVGFSFACNVSVDVPVAYGEWVGSALRAIQAQGYDVALSMVNRVTGNFQGRYDQEDETHIVCSTFGQTKLAVDWSILWSPAGFRHLMFLAKCLPDFRESVESVSTGLGLPQNPGWGVEWAGDTRTLRFTVGEGRFPAHDMTAKLTELQTAL